MAGESRHGVTPVFSDESFYAHALPPAPNPLTLSDVLNDPYNAPLQEILPHYEKVFTMYWEEQSDRIIAKGGLVVFDKREMTVTERRQVENLGPHVTVIDNADMQERFERGARWIDAVVGTVVKLFEEEPDHTAVVEFDVDDSIAKIPDSAREDFYLFETDEEQMNADYEALVLSPEFEVAVHWLHERYGDRLEFGLLSTKLQRGLADRLVPMLQKLCPGTFENPDYVVSMRDGRFSESMREQLSQLRKNDTSLEALLRDEKNELADEAYANAGRVIDLGHPSLAVTTDEDLKLLVLMRLEHEANAAFDPSNPSSRPVTVVSVDNWPSFDHIIPGHSRIRAVPLKALNAQFHLPEDNPGAWGAEGESLDKTVSV